jgi:hypothetical protein
VIGEEHEQRVVEPGPAAGLLDGLNVRAADGKGRARLPAEAEEGEARDLGVCPGRDDGLGGSGKTLPFTLGSMVADVRAAVGAAFETPAARVELLLGGCFALEDGSCLGDYGLPGGAAATSDVDVLIVDEGEEGGGGGKGKAAGGAGARRAP